MQYIVLLKDPRLLFICILAALVSMLTCATVASRPAAITTKRVAMAFTIYSIFFMITRFANLFYLPLLGAYVDKAEKLGDLTILLTQIRLVIFAACIGSLLAWLLLPTFYRDLCQRHTLSRKKSINGQGYSAHGMAWQMAPCTHCIQAPK